MTELALTLADLAKDPDLAATLPRADAARFYAQVAGVEAALRARLLVGAPAPVPGDAAEQLLTMPEVAAVLAVPESEAYALARRGLLPTVRVGPKYVRVRRADLEAWVRARRDGGLAGALSRGYSGSRGDDGRAVPAAPAGAQADAGRAGQGTGRHRERRSKMGARRAADLGARRAVPAAPGGDRAPEHS